MIRLLLKGGFGTVCISLLKKKKKEKKEKKP